MRCYCLSSSRSLLAAALVVVLLGTFSATPLLPAAQAQIKPDPTDKDQPVGLAQALEIADQHNPQLLAAEKSIQISQAGIGIANEIPNPTLTALHNFGPIIAIGANHTVGVDEVIEVGGKRRKRVKLAKSQYQLASDQFNVTRWSIRQQTRQAYANYAAALANKQTIDELTEYAQRLVNISQTRFEAGAAPEADVIQARLALTQVQTQGNQAQSQIKQARVILNQLLGVSLLNDTDNGYTINDNGIFKAPAPGQKTALIPQPEEVPIDIKALYDRALKVRPDLLAASQQVEVNRNQITVLKALRIPDPDIGFQFPYLRVPNGDQAPSDPTRRFYFGETITLSIPIPLFHNQQSEIRQANATLQQSQLQVIQTVHQLQADIRTAYLSYELDRTNILTYQTKLLPDARQNLYLAQESYRYGKSPLSNVILAQQSTEQVVQSYLQAITNFQTDWGNLEQAVGEPLPL